MRRYLLSTALLSSLVLFGGLSSTASACPMCKSGNEIGEDGQPNTRPQAYMYSILFMMAMPATLLAGFGFACYRMTRHAGGTDATEINADV
ncbi:MAG: hypothetical protein R3B90_08630 [Planctomycetaceae bacterium]